MTWLIILFVLMLVVSPVMWLRPSPRQRRVADLRSEAMKTGLSIKLEAPPLHDTRTAMPAYRWHYPQERPGPDFVLVRDSESADSLKPYAHGWRWRKEPLRPLPEALEERFRGLLSRLPRDALVIESNHRALTLWWWESQDFSRFATYLEDFTALRDGLAGRPDDPGMSDVSVGRRT
ncbi:preprotein translocase subunit YajC [Halomonas sp. LBP4]|uniref:preprotein translocase subunit YajC n=1 Tax=Halomonas sp. LBP4 TaxID=2044917 RepID=UPI000D75EEAF|nr:preprotein translocase subunit YajC [Halomonas sp. LBP4]PXX99732.1 preprotein translocase subunit YajC [Halomonas sp. LBP4]